MTHNYGVVRCPDRYVPDIQTRLLLRMSREEQPHGRRRAVSVSWVPSVPTVPEYLRLYLMRMCVVMPYRETSTISTYVVDTLQFG